MHLPLKRVFDEKRRLVIPVLAGLALNLVLSAGVVYPLGAADAQHRDARARPRPQRLQEAEREDADARGIIQRRDRNDKALKAFYTDVLPSSHAEARQATFLRLTQLAQQHNLEQSRRSIDPKQQSESSLARLQISMTLQGDYEDIRQFIHQVESGQRFHRHRQHLASAGPEPGAPLTLALNLSTYYRVEPDGR